MTKNKIVFAAIAAILAVSIASSSFAIAEPAKEDESQFDKKIGLSAIKMGMLDPQVEGSVNIGNNILSNAKIDFTEAATIAANEAKGDIINGNLGIQNDFLVYTFAVVADDKLKNVIVDAGNGKVLHVSEPGPTEVVSMLTSHRGFFFHASPGPLALSVDDDITFQKEK